MMKTKISNAVGLWAVMLGLIVSGCGKEKPAPIDPHSPSGVNLAIQALEAPLSQALKTNDLQFIHKQMYYIETVADTLAFETQRDQKLSPEQKQRVADLLVKLKQVAQDTDNSSGRNHQDSTAENLQRLFAVFKELDAELAPKPGQK